MSYYGKRRTTPVLEIVSEKASGIVKMVSPNGRIRGNTQHRRFESYAIPFNFKRSEKFAPKTFPIMEEKPKEEINMEVKTKGYTVEQVIEVIEMLSHSQGFYGRLLEEIMYIEANDPEKFKTFKELIEGQEFKDPVDVVLFFEQ